jgi:hypothetical protein
MIRMTQNRVLAAAVTALLVAMVALSYPARRASGRNEEGGGSGAGPHYTVVMTEGHNLLVTDNGANKLLFYTIDKDAPIGSPLKLRASISLADVGKDEIRITPHNLENFEPRKK